MESQHKSVYVLTTQWGTHFVHTVEMIYLTVV